MEFDWNIYTTYWPYIVSGVRYTVLICVVSITLGTCLASMVCLLRISRNRALRGVAICYIEVLRNTPFLIQAFIVFYALPAYGVRMTPLFAGILTLTIYGSAYFAEIMRGAINAVPKGQLQSARALGIPYFTAMKRMVLPQSIRGMLPPLTNQFIMLIKESSVLSVITVAELTYEAHRIVGISFSPVEVYVWIAIIYWVINSITANLMERLQRRAEKAHALAYGSRVLQLGGVGSKSSSGTT